LACQALRFLAKSKRRQAMIRKHSNWRWGVAACIVTLQLTAATFICGQNDWPPSGGRVLRNPVVAKETEQALVRARAALAAGNFARAYAEYRVALKAAPASGPQHDEALRGFVESGTKLARQRLAEGQLEEAQKLAREVLKERPNYQPALELLGNMRAQGLRGGTMAEPTRKGVAPTRRKAMVKKEEETRKATTAGPRAPTMLPPGPAPDLEVPAEGPEETSPLRRAKPPPPIVYERRPMAAPSVAPTAAIKIKQPLVKVFFATDRLPSGARGPSKYFGPEWNKAGDHLLTGFVTVSIPPVHKEGKVERPFKFFTFERSEDPKKHFVLTELKVANGDDFYGALRSEYDHRELEKRSAFVFIHGFNVTFDDAAYRTAQLAYDLDFEGIPIMYSWPSQGRLLAYDGDRETVDWSSPHLQSFLERVARESGALRIHLVAHSMGNQLLANALVGLGRQQDIQPFFDNVIMAAPDVNAYTFTDQVWPAIKNAAKHFTLYASSDDQALVTSKKSKGANDFDRLGEAGPKIVVVSGLDTVDASGIDTSLLGHSYVDSCKPVMNDLQLIIEKGLAPLERKLRDRYKQGLAYWAFR
jgi:esterase/lipase superfamily enzyme